MDPIGAAEAVPAGWWLGSPPAARGVRSRSGAGAPGGFPVRFVLAELVSGAAPGVERAVSPRDRWRRSSLLNGIYDGGISVGPGERVEARPAAGPGCRAGIAPSRSGWRRAGGGGGRSHCPWCGPAASAAPGAGGARPASRLRFSVSLTLPSPYGVPGHLSPSRSF